MFTDCSLIVNRVNRARALVNRKTFSCVWRAYSCYWMFTDCSLLFTDCSLHVHWMFTEYSLNIHWMITECSLNAHWMLTECSLKVHWMFTDSTLNVHWMLRTWSPVIGSEPTQPHTRSRVTHHVPLRVRSLQSQGLLAQDMFVGFKAADGLFNMPEVRKREYQSLVPV
jgi:hypothetical protein